jgi:hypothetical protein
MDTHSNPWPALPSESPYVLACDSEAIQAYNANNSNEKYRIQLSVLPEPFIGAPTAPIVLLNLNPGYGDSDPDDHERAGFQVLLRNNYNHSSSDFPFYSLDPGFENGGRTWWEKKLKPLLEIFERKKIARSIQCIEYFPYHSQRFNHSSLNLPSQNYGFGLIRSAISRGAVVVIMRAKALWTQKIPELQRYSRTFTLNSPQNVVVSPRNCKGFDLIVSVLRDGSVST